ncbi:MAG: hypothetical protein PHU56_02485 [Candidatus Pacebacteria bacterium]|nr:hypothetical protein [Candidatus Paceibacterota bacterium]
MKEVVREKRYLEEMSNVEVFEKNLTREQVYDILVKRAVKRARQDGAFCFQRGMFSRSLGNPETLSCGSCGVIITAYFNK